MEMFEIRFPKESMIDGRRAEELSIDAKNLQTKEFDKKTFGQKQKALRKLDESTPPKYEVKVSCKLCGLMCRDLEWKQ